MERIILFDGECNFCNQSVQFIIERDPKGEFKFASQQSDTGSALLKKRNIRNDVESIVLIEGNSAYIQSTAALRISKRLSGLWKLAYTLVVIPKPLRDSLYNVIAKNRHKWFGVNDHCLLPSPDIRKRFL
ncbi:Predicted thiol-disulfide oxidoreductase YuxK, DCC family [Halobacillus dabanensis]|uniref:Predicted thiol-disulfide oxidoreductase YuxK, DCC family n=1 Tax=Halobacillus dabanensis TaxID=240302 RepID=A0A1I3P1D0_HALDA|nr:DCC1-like thiol-disulfide oxidoreductase family protein [Halobacillus dabanensis]SFJ15368.1 Predicted thiol-disulfide oxidoreductase YuxK, DCC family [Halobacillus dabanensis]